MLFASILFLFCHYEITWAAVAFGKAEQHQDHPRQCFDDATKKYYSVGSEWPMANQACGLISCEEMGKGSLYFSYTTCPSVSVGAPCFLEENLTAEYPNCCPRIECPPAAAVEEVPNEINEIEDDQIMMGGQEYPVMVSYDASLDQDYLNYDEYGFSNVFPLWRDFHIDGSTTSEKDANDVLFSPRK